MRTVYAIAAICFLLVAASLSAHAQGIPGVWLGERRSDPGSNSSNSAAILSSNDRDAVLAVRCLRGNPYIIIFVKDGALSGKTQVPISYQYEHDKEGTTRASVAAPDMLIFNAADRPVLLNGLLEAGKLHFSFREESGKQRSLVFEAKLPPNRLQTVAIIMSDCEIARYPSVEIKEQSVAVMEEASPLREAASAPDQHLLHGRPHERPGKQAPENRRSNVPPSKLSKPSLTRMTERTGAAKNAQKSHGKRKSPRDGGTLQSSPKIVSSLDRMSNTF